MSAEVLSLRGVDLVREGRAILDGVDLTVRAGEHWALLGPNGAGKSTILGLCGARRHPTRGTVHVLGERLGRVDIQTLHRRIGHVDPRHDLRSPLTVLEVTLTGLTGTVDWRPRWQPTPAEVAVARGLVADLGLAHRAHDPWPTLSQGERGRALVARALLPGPALLLLDEPSTGLDVAAREQLLETLDAVRATRPHVASVLVTHHLEELPTTTSHALLLAHGRVVAAGAAADVLVTEHVTRCFDHPVHVERRFGRWHASAGHARPPRLVGDDAVGAGVAGGAGTDATTTGRAAGLAARP
ncbi:ATP-binding cassette domain-containing protein [Cellulosimicrobium sp. ES-005]|uniref:ATP-binding cassette domain-containing protein n=1 Tax=Cellulosimicrobium sp. ES-005 TaxID=3163031 RepID=A0AAU8G8H0_9MICO